MVLTSVCRLVLFGKMDDTDLQNTLSEILDTLGVIESKIDYLMQDKETAFRVAEKRFIYRVKDLLDRKDVIT